MKIDTYTHASTQPYAANSAIKMKQSTRPPVIAKKPPPQKGKRYKTKISIPGQTEERQGATSGSTKGGQAQAGLGSGEQAAEEHTVTFGKPLKR